MEQICKTCEHWEDHEEAVFLFAWGNCYGMCSPHGKVRGAHNIETQEDFTCGHWEEKDPSFEGQEGIE